MTMPEPHLALGDSGEWVLRLQTRLHALGMVDGALDGSFGDTTQAAVAKLQELHGLPADGEVGDATWAALTEAEHAAGLQDPFAAAAHAAESTPVGTVSEDQQWEWDGESWQPRTEHAGAAVHAEESSGGHLSADGQWRWDGNQWQPVS